MKTTKPIASIVLMLIAVAGVGYRCVSAQQTSPPVTVPELLRILRITTFRVHTPSHAGAVWDIKILKPDELKPRGGTPKGLTTRTDLLSLRDLGNDVYEFTLPQRDGAYSQGNFELCKEHSCSGQYEILWLKQPEYSTDGSQCLLGKLSNFEDEHPSAYIALVRVNSTPEH